MDTTARIRPMIKCLIGSLSDGYEIVRLVDFQVLHLRDSKVSGRPCYHSNRSRRTGACPCKCRCGSPDRNFRKPRNRGFFRPSYYGRPSLVRFREEYQTEHGEVNRFFRGHAFAVDQDSALQNMTLQFARGHGFARTFSRHRDRRTKAIQKLDALHFFAPQKYRVPVTRPF